LDLFFGHLVYYVIIWLFLPRFVMLYQEKSGNPDSRRKQQALTGDGYDRRVASFQTRAKKINPNLIHVSSFIHTTSYFQSTCPKQ
jgi:hypothetical protein